MFGVDVGAFVTESACLSSRPCVSAKQCLFVCLFASLDFEKMLTTEAALSGCFLPESPHVSFLFVLFDLCMNSNKTLAMCRPPTCCCFLSSLISRVKYVIFLAFRAQFLQTRMDHTDM